MGKCGCVRLDTREWMVHHGMTTTQLTRIHHTRPSFSSFCPLFHPPTCSQGMPPLAWKVAMHWMELLWLDTKRVTGCSSVKRFGERSKNKDD
jgi:hypothetical protein